MSDVWGFIGGLPANLEWVLGLLVAIGALWVIGKKVVKWWKTTATRLSSLWDSLAGFEELRDPMTDDVVRPAIPGINSRMLTMEHWQAEVVPMMQTMSEAITKLADVDDRLTHIETRLDQLEHN